ncbi:MAG: hypothetical protein ACM31C_19665 [Acidobacteriota bacterium]
MSDAKKTGSRDISELKQRLGLKKGAAAAQTGSTTGGARSNGAQSGGVVPPPGLNLPPPPGVAQPAQPVIPNAAEDPFGAMNAMAAHAIPQRAPEIVIVNDGRPVENVGAQSHTAMLARIGVPAAIALIVGIAVGKIGTSASYYNAGLKDAKYILGDKSSPSSVAGLKKTLSDIDTALDEAKTKKNFKPDLAVDAQLKSFAKNLDVKSEVIFKAKQNALNDQLAGQIVAFYAGVAEVKDMIDQHNKAALGDDIALKKAKENADAATIPGDAALGGNLKYAVMVSAPTDNDKGADFGAKIVEIAGVYCGTSNAPQPRCPEGEAPNAIAYRNDPGGVASKGDLATQGSDSVPTKKLLTILPNGIRDGLIKGAEGGVSEYYYTRRLRALYERIHGKIGQDGKPTGGLLEDGNKLESALQTESNRSSRFSFFM